MRKKLKDSDVYKIQKELFFEAVDELSCRVGTKIQHDYGSVVKDWDEVPIYVLSSLLVQSLNSVEMSSLWNDLYDETKDNLISLSKTINYKLGSDYPTKEAEEEFLSKIKKHKKEFEKTQEEIFIHSCSLMIFKQYIYTDSFSEQEHLKETKRILRNLVDSIERIYLIEETEG